MTMLVLILGDAPKMISMLSGSNHVRKPEAEANEDLGLMTQVICQVEGCNLSTVTATAAVWSHLSLADKTTHCSIGGAARQDSYWC